MGLTLRARLRARRELIRSSQERREPNGGLLRPACGQEPAAAFTNGSVIDGPLGTCVLLKEKRRGAIRRGGSPEALYDCLRLVYGVGPYFARKLREEGYEDLHRLCQHPRWGEEAKRLVSAIGAGDVGYLARRGAPLWHLLGYFTPEEVAFVDIETTGLAATRPLFLVGTLTAAGGQLEFNQYLARCFDEEAAVVAAAAKYLGGFPVWITFNGQAFDVPYLRTRAEFFGLTLPRPKLHVDLLSVSRRLYRRLLPNCRLTTLEAYLLNRVRFDDVPGHLVPELYHQFVVEQNPALLQGVLRHNIDDLFALSQLLHLLQQDLGLENQAG